MEEFEEIGVWWLPKHEDHKVPGILRYSPIDGISLRLIGGSFKSQMIKDFGKDMPNGPRILTNSNSIIIETILGESEGGQAITLYECRILGLSDSFYANFIFKGHHFQSEEDILFDKYLLNYTYTENWFAEDIFSRNQEDFSKIDYKLPDDMEINLNDFTLTFRHNLRVSHLINKTESQYENFVHIQTHKSISFGQFWNDISYHLRNFFSLAIGTTIHTRKMMGSSPEIENKWGVEIFYIPKGKDVKTKPQIFQHDMLFTYSDIANNPQLYLLNWFSKAEKLNAVHDLYFGLFYIPSMYIHLQFLTLAQALEVYHRQMHEGTYMSLEDYQSIGDILKSAIPIEIEKSHRDSLESRINYGYEYSLRKRLTLIFKDILRPYDSVINRLFPDKNKSIAQLVETRNYLTHYAESETAEPITDPIKQYEFVKRMKVLVQLCFLHEMGFSPEIVDKIAQRKNYFRQ